MVRKFLGALVFVFFYSQLSVGSTQTIKILFDASKAESAGSADWVIDANMYNIGYGGGPPVVGTGNESNPSNIPSPAQSGITAATAETYWDGALSYWAIDLVREGYQVETLPYNGQISYGNAANPRDLSNYKVFIVCEPNIVFTTTEKTAIMHFVQNGGGLFMVSDHDISDRNFDGWDSPHIWNDLMTNNAVQNNPFGISFDYLDFSGVSTNVPNLPGDSLLHGPMGNVTEVQWFNGTSMTLNPTQNNTVKGVVYTSGSSFGNNNVMMAYARYGNGKVAAIGDSSPADDGSGDPNDILYDGWITDANGNHEKLIINATIWLATSNTSTAGIVDPIASVEEVKIYPNPFIGSTTVELDPAVNLVNSCLKIYDVSGEVVKSIMDIRQSSFILTQDQLSPGIYFYSFYNEGVELSRGKLFIGM